MTESSTMKEKHLEVGTRGKTWCGVPVEPVYRPGDVKNLNYERDLGDPGQYPFTRGIYSDMYRGRLWSRRLITGCATPQATNERLKFLLANGESAINIICDQPTQVKIDPDHPMAAGSVGCAGVPIACVNDVFAIMDGIPLDQVSTMLTAMTPVAFPSYLLLAEKLGIPFSSLRGTGGARVPSLAAPVCAYGGREWYKSEFKSELKEFVERLVYLAKYLPKWYPASLNSYNIRETGVTAAEEMAFIMCNAFEAMELIIGHGVDPNLVASKMAFTCSSMIDIFEEVAKFRAARRIWARTLKERFGVTNTGAMRMKVHVNTAGVLYRRQQALINISRGAYSALAAVLGGCQSLQIASYDEAISIPTDEAATIALRTEQILAHETGVANVADPLGGSYYVEAMTSKMEEQIVDLIEQVASEGGWTAALESGWVDKRLETGWLNEQKDLENNEKIVVGVNAYTIPEEEDREINFYRPESKSVDEYVNKVREFKKTRSQEDVKRALRSLRVAAEKGDESLLPYEMECCRACATTAEISGATRMGRGLPYDPMGVLEYPF